MLEIYTTLVFNDYVNTHAIHIHSSLSLGFVLGCDVGQSEIDGFSDG